MRFYRTIVNPFVYCYMPNIIIKLFSLISYITHVDKII